MRNRVPPLSALLLGLAVLAAGEARPGPVWVSLGPHGGGRMTSLVASPSSPSILYAGTDAGGVQVSRDGGRSWRPAPGVLPDPSVSALAVDPRRPDVVFAATAGGLARSLDGGRSWIRSPLTPVVSAVAVHPRDPALVFAGGERGLFVSRDGGASWRRTGLPAGLYVSSLALDPFSPARLYVDAVAGDGTRGGVYGSADGGRSWTYRWARSSGSLLADPAVPGVLYLATEAGLFRSTDGGLGWRKTISRRLRPRLAAVPGSPPRICAVTLSGAILLCSRDQGRSFQPVETSPGPVQAIAGGGEGSLVVGRSDGEIVQSPDGGVHWEESGQGFVSSQVGALATGPGYLLAGGRGGLFRSSDGGATWAGVRAENQPELDFPVVLEVKVDPEDGRVVHAVGLLTAGGSGLWKSTDGGQSWRARETGPEVGQATSLAIDPRSPQTLYLGAVADDGGVWKSTDGGDSWRSLPVPQPADAVWKVAVSPADSTLYAATGRGIARSRDGGETWQQVLAASTFDLPLALAPSDPRFVYTGGFRSRDGGDTWEPMPDPLDLAPYDLAVDPRDPETVYAGTGSAGVWRKVGAADWERFGSGLINPQVEAVFFDPERPERLLCGTAGAGAYELILE